MDKRYFSPEAREKISNTHKGKEKSEEHRRKISASLIGNTRSKGKPWSEARRKAQENVSRKRLFTFIGGRKYHKDWPSIRKSIYKRDSWICQECGVHCKGNGKKNKICCHHIDYDINNNDNGNLITLCASCHAKTNFSRDDWTKYYKEKLLSITPSE